MTDRWEDLPKEMPSDVLLELLGFKRASYCRAVNAHVPRAGHYVHQKNGTCWNLNGSKTHIEQIWEIILREEK